MFQRRLQPASQKSYFLFGPRQTGKSTFVRTFMQPDDLYIDLLPQRTLLEFSRNPDALRERLRLHQKEGKPFMCIIDEIQKAPALLDEVHALIEAQGQRFILTGSSARKLKRGRANLLAGRAYTYHLFPLTWTELGSVCDLEKALRIGLLPTLWENSEEIPHLFLNSYVEAYLREEIAQEGLVRNIVPFAQFLDLAGHQDGEVVNYSSMARDCGISVKTVQQYYQILEDTFLAFRLPCWHRSIRRRLIAHPRYYLFDPGVTNTLARTLTPVLNPEIRGRRFEQFIALQLLACIHYEGLGLELAFWRTTQGHEVDILLTRGQEIIAGLEVKSSVSIHKTDLSGLYAFRDEYPNIPLYVLGINQVPRRLDGDIEVLDFKEFFGETLENLARHY